MASDANVQSNLNNGSSRPFLATDFTHSLCWHRALPVHSSFLCPHILAYLGRCLSMAFLAHPIGSSLHPLRCENIRSTPYHISMLPICKGCRNMSHSIRGLDPGCCLGGVRMTYS
ncbi:hypothetical protein COCCADRAFT_41566 [Bipolaris zeicola 26-R-13]|uniref:Uncharacterized protein n=1 Tax=Cochliobolus carbonum (strain 26-R-13) TaxID=930089 RepID=W6XYM3_COCC2|nr:uncharacterized protein COCCADRAFT_41566 [Bipolaris zeicola 26-R-13]EUC27804.1 hypothetical protein COCCADRAFT_41566 [Bipolaris zeicola 26-R-13]